MYQAFTLNECRMAEIIDLHCLNQDKYTLLIELVNSLKSRAESFTQLAYRTSPRKDGQCRSLMHLAKDYIIAKDYIKQKKQNKATRSLKEIYKYKLEAYEQEVCELLVSCYEDLEDSQNVIIWLEKLYEYYEKEGDQILSQSVEILLKLAQIYESNEKYDKAAKRFTELGKLQPNSLKYYQKITFHLAQNRNGKEAIITLSKAEAIDSSWKETLCLQRGEIYLRMGKYNDVLKNLKEVIQLNKKCEAADYAIGKSFKQNGQYEQAIKAFLECLQLNPKHNFAHSFLAECYFLNKQFFKYEQRLNILKNLQASKHFIRFLSGKVLQYSLDFQKSNECLIKLLDANLFTELKVQIYLAVAYNFQVLNYLPTSNLWYYKALFYNRESILLKIQIELNWLHIQLVVKTPEIKYTELQNLMQLHDFKSHYMLYIRQLQIWHFEKNYERVDAVYNTISSQLNLFKLQEEITAKVLLIIAFKEKCNLDVSVQMYHEAYEMITEVFTPNTINVLHFEFKTLIELNLDFKLQSNEVSLLARIDDYIKELKEEGYHLKAKIMQDYMQDARIKVEKAVP